LIKKCHFDEPGWGLCDRGEEKSSTPWFYKYSCRARCRRFLFRSITQPTAALS